MKEFIKKLIGRLEDNHRTIVTNDEDLEWNRAVYSCTEIANQLAKEHKYNVMINEQYCWQSCGATERCKECNRLCNGSIDYYENYDCLAEEYNNGWIPYVTGCEMPNEASKVWLSFTTPIASFVKSAWYINGHFEWDNCKRVKETPMAWKPYNVPAPYQPKGE